MTQVIINYEELVERDGLFYAKFTDVPYTGEVRTLEEEHYNRVTEIFECSNGKRNGFSMTFLTKDETTSIEKGYYKDGRKDGLWVVLDRVYFDPICESGNQLLQTEYAQLEVRSRGVFANGKRNGIWRTYFESGKVKEKSTYENGAREGESCTYFEDGKVKEKGTYKNGVREGEWFIKNDWLFQNDQKMQIRTKLGRGRNSVTYEGQDYCFEEKGSYKKGEKNGEWIEDWFGAYGLRHTFHPNRHYAERKGSYRNGVKTGEWITCYSNGNLEEKGSYRNGVKTGEWITCYSNGNLEAQGSYRNGVKTGKWIYHTHLFLQAYNVAPSTEYYVYSDEGELIEYQVGGEVHVKDSGELIKYHRDGKVDIKGSYESGKLEGEWIYCDENGRLNAKGSYKNGKLEGEWIYSDKSGQLEFKGTFKNGEQDGEWVYYHDNGQLNQKGTFKNGEQDGEWVYYHYNGQLNQKGTFKNGEQDGEWVCYHDNDQLNQKGTFKNGKQDGEWIKYHRKGQLLEKGRYKSGEKEGQWVEDHDGFTGKGSYKNREREGEWITYYDQFQSGDGYLMWKEFYKNGKQDGESIKYDREGQLLEKGRYKSGEKEGECVVYDCQGELVERGSYKNGKKEGKWVHYWNYGEVSSTGSYKNGKKEGEWFYGNGQIIEKTPNRQNGYFNTGEFVGFYRSGGIRERVSFKDYLREGEYIAYHRNGQVREKSNYKDGVRQGDHYIWDENGKLKTQYFDEDGLPSAEKTSSGQGVLSPSNTKDSHKEKVIGVYEISFSNSIKDYCYIGQSTNVHTRIDAHYKQLENNEHYNKIMQEGWNKNKESFKYKILLKPPNGKADRKLSAFYTQVFLFRKEKYYIEKSKKNIANRIDADLVLTEEAFLELKLIVKRVKSEIKKERARCNHKKIKIGEKLLDADIIKDHEKKYLLGLGFGEVIASNVLSAMNRLRRGTYLDTEGFMAMTELKTAQEEINILTREKKCLDDFLKRSKNKGVFVKFRPSQIENFLKIVEVRKEEIIPF